MTLVHGDFFNWVLLPLVIMFSRMADVSLGTLRHIFLSKGLKKLVPLLGFIEVLIWIVVVAQIMKNLNNVMCYFAWAAGFSLGGPPRGGDPLAGGAPGLRSDHRGAGSLPDGLRFPHRQCRCWACAFARDLLACVSAGCCAVTFHYRRSAVSSGTQPDDQADVSG